MRSVFFGFILIFLLTGCQGGSPTAMTETSGSNERVLSSILPVASPADAPTTETGGAALTFEGADPLFGHQTGRASGLSWEADVHQPTERMLTYGPYLKSLAPGRYVARVTLMTDDNLADDESVATIDVNDAARGHVLTSWNLTRRLFADGGTPATFDLSFQAEAGANLEFRIAYHGHAYLKHIKTEVFAGDLTGSSSEGLASLLSSPRNDPFSKFSLSDDQGHGMDVLNIEQESENQLVGVYHVNQGGDRFCLRLATATAIDQVVWHNTTEIDCDYASQGTLKRLGDGKYLLAYEKNPGGKRPYIRFLLFPSFQALLANQSMREFSIPQNPQANAEGTPNFRWIRYDGNPDTMTIEIGFHFNQRRDGLDVNGIGFLRGFKSWDYYENTALNRLVREQAQGNIGGRSLIVAGGCPYTLVEAMTVKDDWSSWRLFLYDERAQTIQKLAITNTAGEHSFGNPSLALVQRGSDVLLVGSAYSFNSSQSGTHLFARKMLSSRTRPEFQVTSGPFDLSWAASALAHRIGHAESDGWAVSAGDGGGFLLYGPYDKTLPHAPLTATFSYMVDNNTAENQPVVRFEVYDATTGEIVADQTLSRRQLPAPGTWGTAQLAFDWRYRAGHAVETRVYVMGISYVKVGRVRVRDANLN